MRKLILLICRCLVAFAIQPNRVCHDTECCNFVPMKITPELIEHLCALSKLAVDPAEIESLQSDLEKMVSFVEQLQLVDTAGVSPLLHMSKHTQALRDDLVSGMVTSERALFHAPEKINSFFTVPKVIANPAN
jgi:aspartyl-tRNA(Asn)/glutamyl-tRNA(Gln) amidotransferase subunit C